MIVIDNFKEIDLKDAGAIAWQLWQGELPDLPSDFALILYEYLVRYYYIPDSSFNLAACEDGKLVAFLLAALPSAGQGTSANQWIQSQIRNAEFLDYWKMYRNYLDCNHHAEIQQVRSRELCLLLFGSVRKGAGKLLLKEMEERCRKHDIKSMLLWTDETCDFEYYEKHCFHEVSHFLCGAELSGKHFQTYLFRKDL